MKQDKITLDSILGWDTEVVFNWKYKDQVKEGDFWGCLPDGGDVRARM